MNNDGLQKLKEIGAQKISQNTHISIEHVQAIIHGSFDGLSKIHFLGFISILEREYNLDLSDLKESGINYYKDQTPPKVIGEDRIFFAPKRKKNFTIFYILIAVIIFIIALYYSVELNNKNIREDSACVDNITIENAKKVIDDTELDTNATENDINNSVKENNSTTKVIDAEVIQTEVVPKKEKAIEKSFSLIARKKVWLGYIDVKTNKKYQKTFIGVINLDPNREWLLMFGHGFINIVIDSKEQRFNSKKTLRLLYKDSQIKELTLDEFKKLNRGNAW